MRDLVKLALVAQVFGFSSLAHAETSLRQLSFDLRCQASYTPKVGGQLGAVDLSVSRWAAKDGTPGSSGFTLREDSGGFYPASSGAVGQVLVNDTGQSGKINLKLVAVAFLDDLTLGNSGAPVRFVDNQKPWTAGRLQVDEKSLAFEYTSQERAEMPIKGTCVGQVW